MGQTPTPSPTSHDDGHDHDHDDHDHEEGDNYELAFGLVSAAGMAMAFGAAGIFAPGMQTASKSKAWGAALALSAGMLIFLSLMEFAEESIIEFEEAGFVDGEEFLFFSLSFFLGVFFMMGLEKVLHYFVPQHHGDDGHDHGHDTDTKGGPLLGVGATGRSNELKARESKANAILAFQAALAIVFHNIPEGLAIFVSAVGDDKGMRTIHMHVAKCVKFLIRTHPLLPQSCYRSNSRHHGSPSASWLRGSSASIEVEWQQGVRVHFCNAGWYDANHRWAYCIRYVNLATLMLSLSLLIALFFAFTSVFILSLWIVTDCSRPKPLGRFLTFQAFSNMEM